MFVKNKTATKSTTIIEATTLTCLRNNAASINETNIRNSAAIAPQTLSIVLGSLDKLDFSPFIESRNF